MRGQDGRATAVAADVSRDEDVARVFAVAERLGGPTALVCAAGVLTRASVEETTRRIWDETLAVNLTGTFLCCRAAFAPMRRAGGGRIVTIASLSGVYGTEKFPGLAAYNVSKYGVVGLTEAISKYGVVGLTEAIAVEGRRYGITAVCVSPGAVDTEMLRRANPALRPGMTPDQLAGLIVTLFDTPWAAASGANIPVFSNA
jgi:NAD(P)-dependent dehydrogenase (short-subunit alcohol dehydrogenase family)